MSSVASANRRLLAGSNLAVTKAMHRYYRRLTQLRDEGKPVAWIGIGFPTEILFAMDVVPIYPQTQAAFESQRPELREMFSHIEEQCSVPKDTCAEVKGMIGLVLHRQSLPFQIPKPDVLVSNNNICGATTKGLALLAEHLKTPLVFCDVPFVYDEPLPHVAEYVYRQLLGLIADLERITGRKLDREKLHELWVARGVATDLLEDTFRLSARRRPAPFDALDMFLFYTAYLMLEPNAEMIDLFSGLYNEASEAQRGSADELRLLWHYLPIYSRKRFFKELFAKHQAVVATATFLWPDAYKGLIDPIFSAPVTRRQVDDRTRELFEITRRTSSDPVRWLADFMLLGDVNRNIAYKNEKMGRLVHDFGIDGVVMHADRGCRPQTLPQHAMKNYLADELGIPVLVFDSDPMDDRHFAPAQITTRFEAFFEGTRRRKAAEVRP